MKTKNQNTIEKMNQLLADHQIFYQNLRGLHWNVKGNNFFILHEKFEEMYNETADVIDEIAERILTIGGQPMHTYSDFMKIASIDVVQNESDGIKGVVHVLETYENFIISFNEIMKEAAGNDDEGTAAMMSEWIGQTEKKVWMLRAYLS